ncbi:12934_t:CDS:1, partial [Racocetra persica]
LQKYVIEKLSKKVKDEYLDIKGKVVKISKEFNDFKQLVCLKL